MRRLRPPARRRIGIGLLASLGFAPAMASTNCLLDTEPPVLEITSPLRSESLIVDLDAETIEVTGSASDDAGIARITIDGVEVFAGAGGTLQPFTTDTPSRWGLNTIVALAVDVCGKTHRVVQSYLRSGNYFDPSIVADPDAAAPAGFKTRLNAPLLDDSHRATVDDLATVAGLAIGPLPLATPLVIYGPGKGAPALPDCVNALDNWPRNQNRVRVTATSFDSADVRIESIEGVTNKLVGRAEINWIEMGIRASTFRCVVGNLDRKDRDGTLHLTNVVADFDIVLATPGAGVSVTVQNVDSDFDLDFTIDCTFQAICNAITNRVPERLEAVIVDAISNELKKQEFSQSIETYLEALLPGSQPIELPPPVSITLNLDAAPDSVENVEDAIDLTARTQFYPSAQGPTIPVSAPGGVRRGGAAPGFALTPYELGYAMRDDMINQLFWAVWYGGGLELPDLTEELAEVGLELDEFSLDGGLPQVLMPGAVPGQAEIGRGDNAFLLAGDLADLVPGLSGAITATGFWSSLVIGTIDVDESGKRLAFRPASSPGRAHVEIESLSPALLVNTVVPILEAKFLALDIAFTKLLFSELELPRIASESVGGTPGFELFTDEAVADRPNDNAVRVTGDLGISAICGDGLILGNETCDDGNDQPGDGCRPTCRVALGYACSGEPSACVLTCGNSVVDAGEQCDDGGFEEGDGCSSTCQNQDVYTFQGTALGGYEVSVEINGLWTSVTTEEGESSVVIAQKVAHAVDGDPTLSLLYPTLVAGATGARLHVTGSIGEVVITDPGLLASFLFADGFESGDTTAWGGTLP